MAARYFIEDSRYLALMPAVHAALSLFEKSNNADDHALMLAHVLRQLVDLLADIEHEAGQK